jgi:hypothetical protein
MADSEALNTMVLVAPEDKLRDWTPHLMHRVLIRVPETDVPRAVEIIRAREPVLVALENAFAATPRGLALRVRLANDPALSRCKVCLIAPQGRGVSLTPLIAPDLPAARAAAWDPHGTRRAPRRRLASATAVYVDADKATLIDLSSFGAQLSVSSALWPGTRCGLILRDDERALTLSATVIWAHAEDDAQDRHLFRTGVEFRPTADDAAALNALALRYE